MCDLEQEGKYRLVPISVNQSRILINNPDYVKNVEKVISRYDTNVENLEIEITETVFFDEKNKMIEVVKQLKELGLNLAMDDFGSGYTSITELATLSVDMIKFSISFVHNCIASKKGTTMLKGMIQIFNKIQIPCICKGVENMLQERLLRECGCKMAQGDVLEPAMDVEKFEKRFIYKD
jgi:EAL domain-containing protein (putative c-di-GMP-specific phosphodiesterase class I)